MDPSKNLWTIFGLVDTLVPGKKAGQLIYRTMPVHCLRWDSLVSRQNHLGKYQFSVLYTTIWGYRAAFSERLPAEKDCLFPALIRLMTQKNDSRSSGQRRPHLPRQMSRLTTSSQPFFNPLYVFPLYNDEGFLVKKWHCMFLLGILIDELSNGFGTFIA